MLGTSAALSTAVPTRNARYRRRRQIGAQHEREYAKYLTKNNFIFISEILEHVFDVVDQMRPAFIRI